MTIHTNMAVLKSKFWKNCVMKMWFWMTWCSSASSTCFRMSISHSKCRWLAVTQMKYTYSKVNKFQI